MAKTKSSGHFLALDGWRGICACMVALFHFHANSHIEQSFLIRNAGFFVDFFFVLSGFVIFSNYYDKIKNGFSVGKFMLLRFGRLYPLHIIMFILFVSGDVLQVLFPWLGQSAKFPPFQGPGQSWNFMLSNIFLVQGLGIHDRLSFNGPSWSISCEFYTYLVFALILAFGRKPVIVTAAITVIATVFMIFNAPHYMDATYDLGFIRCIAGFGSGGIAWLLFRQYTAGFSSYNKTAGNIAELIILSCVVFFVYAAKDNPLSVAAPLVFSLTVFVYAFEKGIISRVLKTPFFVLLGTLSYSIYMTHGFLGAKIFNGFGHIAQKISGIQLYTNVDGTDFYGANIWMGDAFCAAYLVALIIGSYISYRIIEVPGRNFFRKLADKKFSR